MQPSLSCVRIPIGQACGASAQPHSPCLIVPACGRLSAGSHLELQESLLFPLPLTLSTLSLCSQLLLSVVTIVCHESVLKRLG
jgi:hypothetical protein